MLRLELNRDLFLVLSQSLNSYILIYLGKSVNILIPKIFMEEWQNSVENICLCHLLN